MLIEQVENLNHLFKSSHIDKFQQIIIIATAYLKQNLNPNFSNL